jgi:predicted glycoside hydrolase/deacetylase ChbG (UPF0249 family)
MKNAGQKRKRVLLWTMLVNTLALLVLSTIVDSQSPYVGQESREIKALSAQEVSDYLSGKGMGLAKAAELNGYPGPVHVLELATELELTPEQKSKTEVLFKKMQAQAIPLGKQLIEEERTLDHLFASHAISSEHLGQVMLRIGRLQSQVRQVHLDAHIEESAMLTSDQVKKYNLRRGYGIADEREIHRPAGQH